MGYSITLVEDDDLISALVTYFLESSGKFKKIDTYNDGTVFLDSIEHAWQGADAIVMDFKLGGMNAELLLKELHEKAIGIPVIILTSHYNEYLMGYMIKSGVAAYLSKTIKPDELLSIIEEVIEKGHYISQEQFHFLKTAFSGERLNASKQPLDITERDIDVIYLLANQLTAKEIAEKLYISPKTVEGYKNALFSKTGTKSVVGLVLYAIQNDLIDAESVDLGLKNA
ncbi:MAG: response regulator transcription factor [Crocinitomicaceae bacterium]|nr:response regulator transcription factor [Crocinitomicaceae bacterium]